MQRALSNPRKDTRSSSIKQQRTLGTIGNDKAIFLELAWLWLSYVNINPFSQKELYWNTKCPRGETVADQGY